MKQPGRLKTKPIKIKVVAILCALLCILVLCILNLSFLLWQPPKHTVVVNPDPFLLVPTTEGFANSYLNVNDAWFQFTKSRGRKVSILRTKVPHYENIHFCVGDYLTLPPGIACSDLLADEALQGGVLDATTGAALACKFPRHFYRDIHWFVDLAESWLGAAAQFMYNSTATVEVLAGVRATEEASWDYEHESCGLYRYIDYHFSASKNFPVVFQPHIMEQYAMLLDLLVEMNEMFMDPSSFTVVHWRRGDEVTRYYEGDALPLNCRPVEEFEAGLRQLLARLPLPLSLGDSSGSSSSSSSSSSSGRPPHAVYISTNEQNATSLGYLEARGYVTYRALLASPGYRRLDHYPALTAAEEFLFELNMMAAAGRFVFFGNSKIPTLVERLLQQRKQAFTVRTSTTLQSSGIGSRESSVWGAGSGDVADTPPYQDAFMASAFIKSGSTDTFEVL